MAEVTPKPRTLKAFQWTGFPIHPDKPSPEFDEMMDVLKGISFEWNARANTLVIQAVSGRLDVWPTRDVPEHEYEGRTIEAQTIQGQWVVRDEHDHVHRYEDAAYRAIFG